ncbi:MAG: flagellar motor switch protein FliG [Opitutaceae bacterium]|jgi:flagellar motor switch protein FliG
MAELDYTKLTRVQKLAAFLIVLGPEAASEILRQFDDGELESICREMGQFPVVTESLRTSVMEEFAPIIGESLGCTLGGLDYARRTLEITRGEYKAALMLSRVGADPVTTSSSELMADIGEMDGRQIHNLLKDEQPQTIAYLLSHLGSAKSAEVFMLLPAEQREDVVERLGTIESTPRDLVGKIVRNLSRHVSNRAAHAYHPSGGVRAVADLLNNLDKENSKSLLGRIEERNATLGAAVRRKMFSFEDIRRLQPADLQRVLREVDSAHLATAMKSATESLRESIYASISKRAAEALRDEISMLGPVRLKDVETAQDAIIQVVRRLEDEGAVTIGDGDGDMVA